MTTDDRLKSVIADALRNCTVEGAAPVRLIREGDIFHVTHMVAAVLRDAGWVQRDEVAAEATAALTQCNCGWGGVHDPDNPRCERNAALVDRLREELDEHRAHYVDPVEHARVVAALARVEALCAPRTCHQCGGSGQQERGESSSHLRVVDAPPETETCHLCRGEGMVTLFAVTFADLRAALAPTEDET